MTLEDGARVGVIGGGPAGSFFSHFLLEMAARVHRDIRVDIYEPKNLLASGPAACNMCGGIVSESLVQLLAAEGINLPPAVVQRGIDSYVVHMREGSLRIRPPGLEKRIAAVHRGGGPRGMVEKKWDGLDGFLLGLAKRRGARVIAEAVDAIAWEDGKPHVTSRFGTSVPYDLIAVAVGVNGKGHKLLAAIGHGYTPPATRKTFICEFRLGTDLVDACLGSAMHVFLLNLPRLDFAALIPKGEYATLVLLGTNVDPQLVTAVLNAPEVKQCFPPGWDIPADYCRCFPLINVGGPPQPFADRILFIGDAAENRLYKDGIGGAYTLAKAAAKAVVFGGVSANDLRKHYLPACRAMARDNRFGRGIFAITHLIQKLPWSRRGVLRMARQEQEDPGQANRLSGVLWDTFTGSAPYRDIFARAAHPLVVAGLARNTLLALSGWRREGPGKEESMGLTDLGRVYSAGQAIVRQGEPGDCMYVIQAGEAEVVRVADGQEVRLGLLAEGDFFGEMALFENDVRSATVRAVSEVRAITVDKKILLRKMHEDPSLTFRILRKMANRIRELDALVTGNSAGRQQP